MAGRAAYHAWGLDSTETRAPTGAKKDVNSGRTYSRPQGY